MNIDIAFITKLFADLGRPFPARDWLAILLLTVVLGGAGVLFAGYVFLGVQTGTLIPSGAAVPRAPIPVTKEAIQSVLTTYQARAGNYASKVFPPVDLSDPRARNTKR